MAKMEESIEERTTQPQRQSNQKQQENANEQEEPTSIGPECNPNPKPERYRKEEKAMLLWRINDVENRVHQNESKTAKAQAEPQAQP